MSSLYNIIIFFFQTYEIKNDILILLELNTNLDINLIDKLHSAILEIR